jgi:hypothetical protein
MFHGNILKRYKEMDHFKFPGGKVQAKESGTQEEVEGQIFEIDSIIDKDVVKVNGKLITKYRVRKYRVRWKGYRAEDDSWLEYSAQDPDWQEDKHMVLAWERDQAARVVKQARRARPNRSRASMRKVKGMQLAHWPKDVGSGADRDRRTRTCAAQDLKPTNSHRPRSTGNGMQVAHWPKKVGSGADRDRRFSPWVRRDKVNGMQVAHWSNEVGSGADRNRRTEPQVADRISQDGNILKQVAARTIWMVMDSCGDLQGGEPGYSKAGVCSDPGGV